MVVAFFLLDVTYALSVARFDAGNRSGGGNAPDPTGDGRWYYLGTALPLWATWVGASAVGIVFGARVPAGWHLDFAIWLSFIALFGRLGEVPPGVERALRFVPAAVLTAIVAPRLVVPDGTVALGPGNARLLAGLVAAAVAWRTESMLWTIVVGMAALWTLEWLPLA